MRFYCYPAIYMDDKGCDFSSLIFQRLKTVETRSRPTLDRFIGRRVGILSKDKKSHRRILVGYVTIASRILYDKESDFVSDQDRHRVPVGSKYWIQGKKYGYLLRDPYMLQCPVLISPELFVPGDYQALDLCADYERR